MGHLYAGINNTQEKKGLSYELSTTILNQSKGDFLVICPNDSDKFYFLHDHNCNIQEVCNRHGWVIVHQQIFNEDLIIGMGLADDRIANMSIFRTKDEGTYRMWNDILLFVFVKGLVNFDYFTYESNFIGQDCIDGIEYHYIHDYHPLSHKRVSQTAKQVRNTVFAFKDGEKSWLWSKVFSLCISKLSCFSEIKDNAVLVPIPASSKKSHGRRFTMFCKDLSSRLNIVDGFRTLWIEYDREPLKGTYGENKIHNLTFNSKYIKGKHVLLIDDVITTGSSLVQIAKKLLELGAASVRGIFMARTVRDTEMVV